MVFRNGRLTGISLSGKNKRAGDKIPEEYENEAAQMRDYLSGKQVHWHIDLDRGLLTSFQEKVFRELEKVPYGETITYEELAARVKNKNYRRAVAMALSANPFPIVIPCHRVVAKNGPGGFSCGLNVKKTLLGLEGRKDIFRN